MRWQGDSASLDVVRKGRRPGLDGAVVRLLVLGPGQDAQIFPTPTEWPLPVLSFGLISPTHGDWRPPAGSLTPQQPEGAQTGCLKLVLRPASREELDP